jgi:hypothetical protein
MQNGSLDGRVVSSFPVKDRIPDDYDDSEETEEEEQDTGGNGSSEPALFAVTEYFDLSAHGQRTFPLKYGPVLGYNRRYSSVHTYWNNVLQRDTTFQIGADQTDPQNKKYWITIQDPAGWIRSGDILTVKYLTDTPTGGGGDNPHACGDLITTRYKMLCAFGGGDALRELGSVAVNGIQGGPSPGTNGGVLTVIDTIYTNTGFFTHFGGSFKLPKGESINLHGVVDAYWTIRFPLNANASIFGFEWEGSGISGPIGQKANCGLGASYTGEYPTHGSWNGTGSGEGAIGPGGGIVTHTGGSAINLCQLVNVVRDFEGNHQAVPMIFSSAWGGWKGVNGGCGYSLLDDPTFFDDTIYGKYSVHSTSYDMKLSAEVVVVRCADDE